MRVPAKVRTGSPVMRSGSMARSRTQAPARSDPFPVRPDRAPSRSGPEPCRTGQDGPGARPGPVRLPAPVPYRASAVGHPQWCARLCGPVSAHRCRPGPQGLPGSGPGLLRPKPYSRPRPDRAPSRSGPEPHPDGPGAGPYAPPGRDPWCSGRPGAVRARPARAAGPGAGPGLPGPARAAGRDRRVGARPRRARTPTRLRTGEHRPSAPAHAPPYGPSHTPATPTAPAAGTTGGPAAHSPADLIAAPPLPPPRPPAPSPDSPPPWHRPSGGASHPRRPPPPWRLARRRSRSPVVTAPVPEHRGGAGRRGSAVVRWWLTPLTPLTPPAPGPGDRPGHGVGPVPGRPSQPVRPGRPVLGAGGWRSGRATATDRPEPAGARRAEPAPTAVRRAQFQRLTSTFSSTPSASGTKTAAE
jgi:hypothetical protein